MRVNLKFSIIITKHIIKEEEIKLSQIKLKAMLELESAIYLTF